MTRNLFKAALLLFVAVLALCLLRTPASAAGNICDGCAPSSVNGLPACTKDGKLHLCKNNFPDSNFWYYLGQKLNFSSQSLLAGEAFITMDELDSFETLHCTSQRIASLQGIGFFANLTVLNCNNNNLTELDLSYNPKLTDLNCGSNSLTYLRINGPRLKNLVCTYNKLTDLDDVFAPDLETLDCSATEIYHFLTTFPKLTTLICKNLPIRQIDLQNFPSLTSLNCAYCK